MIMVPAPIALWFKAYSPFAGGTLRCCGTSKSVKLNPVHYLPRGEVELRNQPKKQKKE